MKIRHLRVERYRGIKLLDWAVEGNFACLVGPGDSTKSTILDAIELVLSPRWTVPLDDTDFYSGQTTSPIVISATVGDLPGEWKADSKFGLHLRGWSPKRELHDEPQSGDEQVVTIRFEADHSLEATWVVFTDRDAEKRTISYKDRERIGCTRLGALPDRHLTWGRGSVLYRLTEGVDGVDGHLAAAARAAKAAVKPSDLPEAIRKAASRVQKAGAAVGVSAVHGFEPHLDAQSIAFGAGGLALHDGDVPLRLSGLGTKRLLTLGMQREVADEQGIALVDELEHGLEPHRLRRLLRALRPATEGAKTGAQVFATTHSPVVVTELPAEHLRVVRAKAGTGTTVGSVEPSAQRHIRKASEALLGRKVLVCEGKTELGLCRGLDEWWSEQGNSFGFNGIALANGEGSDAAETAVAFAKLGYAVAFWGDSDQPISPSESEMKAEGISVFLWAGGVSVEQRFALDLPWDGVVQMIALGMEAKSDDSLRAQVAHQLGALGLSVKAGDLPAEAQLWKGVGSSEVVVRQAIGAAAKKKKAEWFKNVEMGERLAALYRSHEAACAGSNLRIQIDALKKWAGEHA